MKIEIHYQTQYAYAEPVSFSPHLFRLFPKTDRHLAVRKVNFLTNLDAMVSYRRDLFDNEVASCFYPGHSALMSASLFLELLIEPKNSFSFLVDSHGLELPFQYKPEELRVLSPYLDATPFSGLPFWKRPSSPQPTTATLVALNQSIHENLQYERREHGEAYTPEQTLSLGRGACRDFAVLLATEFRALGLAARLASGYLCEFGTTERRAEGALHAWTEAYLPGAGWIGFDPTNGVLCNHAHITTAVGLDPIDISPIHGRYFHKTSVTAQMSASLSIHEIA